MKSASRFNTIKAKILLQFSVIAFVLLLVGGLLWASILNLQAAQTASANAGNDKFLLQKAVSDHFKWAARLNSNINYGLEFTGSTDPTACDFGKFLYADEIKNSAAWSDFFMAIEPIHNKIHTAATTILAQTDEQAKKTLYVNSVRPTLDELVAVLTARIDEQGVIMQAEETREVNSIRLQMISIVAQVLLLLGMLLFIYRFIRREIVDPILHIEQESRRLAEGSLALDFTPKCKNSDMLRLGDSLNRSIGEIKIYISDIDRAMSQMANRNFNVRPSQPFIGDFKSIENSIGKMIESITDALTQMDSAAEQVSSSSDLISNGAQVIAQGATEQASSVQELSATAAEVAQKVRHNAENADQASAMATNATEAISACNDQMQRLMGSMSDIDAKSKEIGKIIKTIEDIAFQTNILALNAAVEAARAGTAGKGFAVVADEVRNLAGKSAEAAKNTTELIQSSINAIGTGVSLAQATAGDLTNVVTGANETTRLIRSITKATNEQAAEISQITFGLDQITTVVQTNSATSEENAAASEELSGQALLLKQLIATFTLFGGQNT